MSASEFEAQPGPGTNRSAAVTDCKLCGGDRFVTVRLRSPHNKEIKDQFYEEVAPCPDCNPIEVTYWVEGRKFRSMDGATARKAMNQ